MKRVPVLYIDLTYGMNKGKEEGIKTSKQEIARNLLSKNYSTNEISEITGLSVEEIENLK